MHLYKWVCPSVRPSVGSSGTPSLKRCETHLMPCIRPCSLRTWVGKRPSLFWHEVFPIRMGNLTHNYEPRPVVQVSKVNWRKRICLSLRVYNQWQLFCFFADHNIYWFSCLNSRGPKLFFASKNNNLPPLNAMISGLASDEIALLSLTLDLMLLIINTPPGVHWTSLLMKWVIALFAANCFRDASNQKAHHQYLT